MNHVINKQLSTWVKLIVHLSLRVERSETTHSPERCGSSQHFEIASLLLAMTQIILHTHLQELIQRIKDLPGKAEDNSKKRRKLINDLFKMIEPKLKEKSRKVVKVTEKDDFTVEDALQNTYINIQKYLHTYNPEKGEVMAWVTSIYKREFYKLSKKQKKAGIKGAPDEDKDSTSEEQNDLQIISIDAANYDVPVSDEANEVYLEDIKKFIEKDPENFLTNTVIRSKAAGKQISLQKALLMRLQDKTLKEISDETGVPLKSISSCIDRKMPEVKRYITKHTGIEFS